MTRHVVVLYVDDMACHGGGGVQVWVLGGTGRSGRSIAAQLVARGVRPVLVGRDAARLAAVLEGAGNADVVVAATVADMAAAIMQCRPRVVVNTVGPFTESAAVITAACLQIGADYVDLANDLASVQTVLGLHERAVAAGCRLVTGAGFGVTATESVVVRLCAEHPDPARVRVDMVPALAGEAGRIGYALAATVLTGLPGVAGGGRFAGRRVAGGLLVRAAIGADAQQLRLPDGERVTTAAMPLGELVAAQRASGATSVVSASSAAPHGRAVTAMAPVLGALLSLRPVRRTAIGALARVRTRATPAPRAHSWGHARLDWPDGSAVEGWLRVGDAHVFTGAVCAEVAARLAVEPGPPGASTPAALFGPGLAEACGGVYLPAETTEPTDGNPTDGNETS